MGEYFHTTSSLVQLGLTTSLSGLAVGQLFFGPLSDRYGRRGPLLVAMWLFLVSTLLCIFAPDIYTFVAFRLLQGIAGAGGIVTSRSVATDKFRGRELAKMLAVIGGINGIAPVVAPITGGFLADLIGWRGIFCILLGLGVVLLLGCYRLRESLPASRRAASGWGDVWQAFRHALGDRQFLFYMLQMGFAEGVLFAYISSSPFIVQQHYGFSPLAFSLCFAVNSVALGGAAALSVKFHKPSSSSLASCLGMVVFSVAEAFIMLSGGSFWLYEAGLILLLFFMGLTFTSTTALGMECQRQNAGTASALLGAVSFAFGGLVSPLVGLGNIMSTTALIFVLCSLCSLGCMLLALGRRRARLYFSM